MKKGILFFAIFACMSVVTFAQEKAEKPETYFNFWLGKWEATWDEGDGKKGKGVNYIHTTLDGKVLQENFEVTEGQNKGFKGKSFSVYNPRKNEWKQAWADNQGGYFDFTGAKDGELRMFQTAVFEKGDKKIVQRMVFKNITKDSMTWDWESSVDGGKTWKLSWRIQYKKVAEAK